MLLQNLGHLCTELTAIIVLEYLRIDERVNLVNVSNHIGYVFCLICSQRPSNFVSGSDIDSRENAVVILPIK